MKRLKKSDYAQFHIKQKNACIYLVIPAKAGMTSSFENLNQKTFLAN